ncbi:MAG: hypothetical protein FJY66_03505 [Calditrichaeota bacterium]|nr:hypothetical protein [Calditrichota bacterium]
MPKAKSSGLHQILKTIRLLVLCIGAAVGLAMGNSWQVLGVRLLLAWAALYLVFGFFEALVQYLSAKATAKILQSPNLPIEKKNEITNEPSMKLPKP